MHVTIADIARQQALQIAQDLGLRALPTGKAIEGDHRRQPAIHRRADLGKALHHLGEQVRAALGERVGKQHRDAR